MRKALRDNLKRPKIRVCKWCGKPFVAVSGNANSCRSQECELLRHRYYNVYSRTTPNNKEALSRSAKEMLSQTSRTPKERPANWMRLIEKYKKIFALTNNQLREAPNA